MKKLKKNNKLLYLVIGLLVIGFSFLNPGTQYIGSEETNTCQWTVSYGLDEADMQRVCGGDDKVKVIFSTYLLTPTGQKMEMYSNPHGKLIECRQSRMDWGYTMFARDRRAFPVGVDGTYKAVMDLSVVGHSDRGISDTVSFTVPYTCVKDISPVCEQGEYQYDSCSDGSKIKTHRCNNQGQWWGLTGIEKEYCSVPTPQPTSQPTYQPTYQPPVGGATATPTAEPTTSVTPTIECNSDSDCSSGEKCVINSFTCESVGNEISEDVFETGDGDGDVNIANVLMVLLFVGGLGAVAYKKGYLN